MITLTLFTYLGEVKNVHISFFLKLIRQLPLALRILFKKRHKINTVKDFTAKNAEILLNRYSREPNFYLCRKNHIIRSVYSFREIDNICP
jgi:hypothetical protein